MTTVTPAAFALSSTAATPSRVLRTGRLAEGSIHRASRGTASPRPVAGAAPMRAGPNAANLKRPPPSFAPAERFSPHPPPPKEPVSPHTLPHTANRQEAPRGETV